MLGAVLLTGYLGGAVAIHVRAGSSLFETIFPVIVATLVWTGVLFSRGAAALHNSGAQPDCRDARKREIGMRFIAIHKEDRNSEADLPPSAELVAAMGRLIERGLKDGVFLRGEGLHSSSKRARLTASNGILTILEGPYAGSNELIAGVTIIRVNSSDEAIEWASRLAAVLGDAEIEVGQVKEPWDVGMCAKPEGITTIRFLLVQKADLNSEAGVPLTPEILAGLENLRAEMVKAGVFLERRRFARVREGCAWDALPISAPLSMGPSRKQKS